MTTHTTPFASTLPGRYYYDATLYEQEQQRIFSQLWFCAGHVSALIGSGSYLTLQFGGESVLVVRSSDGTLRAYLNVCRHRGARLCTEEMGRLKGSIQCRYHAWTYGLDGRLLGAPNILTHEQFDRSAYGLYPVKLEVWAGLIWLNLADDPPPLETQVREPIIERFGDYAPFAGYGLGSLMIGKTLTYEVQANWKIIIENFMECYHCGPMHPEFCQLLPGFRSGSIYEGDEAATLAPSVQAFSMTGTSSRPPLKGLLPGDERHYYGIVINPNVLLNLLPDHVVFHTVEPQGPERSRVTCSWLFDADVAAQPDFDPMDAVELFDLVNRQDWEVCELTQLGMHSKAFADGGVYIPAEQHIRAFADFVLARLA